MNGLQRYWNRLPAEEKANTWTHLLSLVATLAVVWPLTELAYRADAIHHTYEMPGTMLFLFGMILMFLASTLYHAITEPDAKTYMRIFDHIAIYIMIAGSYSLICLSVVLGKHPRLSLALYLAMGWVALLILYPMWTNMSHAAFAWIFAEGIFYSAGAYFFKHDEEHAYYHAIWHVFITLGAASHTIATWLILSACVA